MCSEPILFSGSTNVRPHQPVALLPFSGLSLALAASAALTNFVASVRKGGNLERRA
jgi:hypothetical protein